MTTRKPYIPPEPMTIQELRDFRSIQDFTWQELSDHLGIHVRTAFDYNSGKNPIPMWINKHCKLIRLHDRTRIKLANMKARYEPDDLL